MELLMEKVRNFIFGKREPIKNDFRNPIWGSDDDDDDDELYSRRSNMHLFSDPLDFNREFTRQMHEIFASLGSMFGDGIFNEDGLKLMDPSLFRSDTLPENHDSNSIRDYYLKPGYHNGKMEPQREDIDLDGKISSNEISGLLKKHDEENKISPDLTLKGDWGSGTFFNKTVITTKVTKADGTVETRKIVKHGNEIVEETTITSPADSKTPVKPICTQISEDPIASALTSLFRNFY